MRLKGLERVRYPHVEHLDGPLWEMRLKGASGIARALYVTRRPQRVDFSTWRLLRFLHEHDNLEKSFAWPQR